ncbi:MAG TPA: C1 family peptidase, partial [Bacteroidia bacterium]|nr:C1 family peptidase [Bacteroidia bacterium]
QQSGQAQAFSPSFMYNQISLTGCQGSYIQRAVEKMQQVGAIPLSQFAYTDEDCSRKPNANELQAANTYRIKGFQRLSVAGDDYKTDLLAMKQYLAQGSPVIIGNMVGGSFMQNMLGKDTWIPTRDDYNENGFGGHCMCVIGYDDFKFGEEGGFQIMNSWGPEWGNNGIAWVRYKDFEYFNKEAYAIYPMGNNQKFDNQKLAAGIGLIDNATKANISLIRSGSVFKTAQAIPKGTKFKIEVNNSIECYVYVLGQDTDASSYILFPYTKKHSPYCGVTGMRLFPRDYSLTADDYGNTDYMAIVITKTPIDFNKLNASVNASRQNTYEAKIKEALAGTLIENVNYQPGNNLTFQCDVGNKNAVAVVVQIDKK